jgi:2-keto-3-deoxy-L-rhamnonate aldolase RhmA
MIETPKAVENAEAIAAVPGIDCLLVGSSDLSMELGIPGENGHAKVQAAVDKVVAGCKKHGKWPGMGGAYSEELLRLYTDKGMKLILAGNDLPMLTGAARAHQAKVRAFQK